MYAAVFILFFFFFDSKQRNKTEENETDGGNEFSKLRERKKERKKKQKKWERNKREKSIGCDISPFSPGNGLNQKGTKRSNGTLRVSKTKKKKKKVIRWDFKAIIVYFGVFFFSVP